MRGGRQPNESASWKGQLFQQLALVRKVSDQIANITDIDELAREVTGAIRETFQYYYVAIYTVEPGQERLRFRACAHSQPHTSEQPPQSIGFETDLGEGIVGNVARDGEAILAQSVEDEPRFRFIDTLPETQSEYALPLKHEQETLGVLDVQSNAPGAFPEIDRIVLQALADTIAIAVKGARLYTKVQKRAEQFSIIADVSRAIASLLDVDAVLQELVTILHDRLHYPFVHVYTVHPGRRKVYYRAGSGPRSQTLKEQEYSLDLDDPRGIIPWVAREGKSLVANDVEVEPLYRPSELPPQNTEAEAVMPFVHGGDVLGVLDIQSDHKNEFADDDVFLFEALADSVAVALRNANLYHSETWRRQVAEGMRDVAGMLTSNVVLDQLLETILEKLEETLPYAVAGIWLIGEDLPNLSDGDGKGLHLAAVHVSGTPDGAGLPRLLPNTDALLERALNNDQPIIRTPRDPVGPLGAALHYPQDYSSIATPLRANEQTLGVLALAHPAPGRYGGEAQRMTAAFASYAAVAIENMRLYNAAQEQAWISTVMLQVAEATQSLYTVEDLLVNIARLTPMLVGVKGCAVFLWHPGDETFQMSAGYGIDPQQIAEFSHRPIHPGDALAFDQVRFGKEPVFIHDCQKDLGFSGETACETSRYNFVLLPLLTRGDILGAFLVEQREPPAEPDGITAMGSERLSVLQGIAQQTAVAVENIRLVENKQAEAYVTAVLLQVAQAVVSLNDIQDILQSIVDLLPILVGIDTGAVYLWNPASTEYTLAHASGDGLSGGTTSLDPSYPAGAFPLLDVVREKDGIAVCTIDPVTGTPNQWCGTPIHRDEPIFPAVIQEKTNLLIGFPLSVKGDVYGVLLAQETGRAPDFRERRMEILTGVAQQAALAIQNDHLNREMVERERLEREFQLAREIQRTFLPSRLPAPHGWDLDIRWRPAREVGGDFYDAFTLPGDRLGLVIADVSDKGMPAALYMTVTRTLIRATAQRGDPPSRVLTRVNELLLMDSQVGLFVTCLYAVVSLKSGQVIYANAGHNLPIIFRAASPDLETLHKGRMALGVMGNTRYDDYFVTLKPGDALLLYTDGVTEAFAGDGEAFGEERLKTTIQNAKAPSASALLDGIDQALSEHIDGARASDDITVMALRYRPN